MVEDFQSDMKHAIVFCVEKGFLEHQCRLLLNSYKTFAEEENVDLIACSPRAQNLPSKKLIEELKVSGVTHITDPLNQDFLHYPIANKLLCCAHIERENKDYSSIMFVDTDTVWLNPLVHLGFQPGLYLKPVGHKGPGTTGINDPMDCYWQQVFSFFELPMPEVNVSTSIQMQSIRGYFNAGCIWANQVKGFFQQWLKDFESLFDSKLTPPGFVSKDSDKIRCLDQVALAVTASRYEQELKMLPVEYNYHLPFRPIMNSLLYRSLEDLVHVHYHKWFQHPGFLDHVTSDEDKQSEQYKWLKEHLPLQPEIDGPFKC